MCELFGLCSRKRTDVTSPLREFFSHSEQHSHGWGMAISFGVGVALEKEPLCANRSNYLRERMRGGIEAENIIAHIRLASVGRLFYCNTHPFLKRDNCGGCWILAHNGTLFDGTYTDRMATVQEGQTDSERILLYIVEEVNRQQACLERRLTPNERFALLDRLVTALSVGNKLNLLVWDGEFMYAHTNYAGTLHECCLPSGGRLFSTHPLHSMGDGIWQPLPFLRLLAYKDGVVVYEGEAKSREYIDPEENYEYKDLDYANL